MTRAIPAEALEHGDHRRYRRGCRCTKCKAGANRQNIKNRYLRQTGRGPMRSANRAADHLLRLRAAGLNDKTIQQLTRICPDVMYRILRREGTIHARTETRIVSVPVPAPTGAVSRVYIPAHGTVRRLRALVAAGWYQAELARRLDKQKENLKQIIARGEDGQVTQYVADEVRAIYTQLHDKKPEDHGVPHAYAERARQRAAAHGWAAPGYFDEDEFDNPNFVPLAPVAALNRNQLGALRREEIIHLAWSGCSTEEILTRLNHEVSIATVRQIVQEWRTGVKRDRKQVAA